MLNLIKQDNNIQEVRFNEKTLGHFIMQEDGYYIFCTQNSPEGWSSYALKLVADKLDEVNKPYDDSVKEYFENSYCKYEKEMSYGCTRDGNSLCEECKKLKIS